MLKILGATSIHLRRHAWVASFGLLRASNTMATATATAPTVEQKLPALSQSEYRQYNRMADGMQSFHNHFRSTWRTLYEAVSPVPSATDANSTQDPLPSPKPLSARRIITLGQTFISQLTMHHGIEETHIFPMLATRMSAFQSDAPHLEQHKQIHAGMDTFEAYLDQCRTGEREFRRQELKQNMDTWGKVLWEHLDDEVATLGADNMRKFWTTDEMARMPM